MLGPQIVTVEVERRPFGVGPGWRPRVQFLSCKKSNREPEWSISMGYDDDHFSLDEETKYLLAGKDQKRKAAGMATLGRIRGMLFDLNANPFWNGMFDFECWEWDNIGEYGIAIPIGWPMPGISESEIEEELGKAREFIDRHGGNILLGRYGSSAHEQFRWFDMRAHVGTRSGSILIETGFPGISFGIYGVDYSLETADENFEEARGPGFERLKFIVEHQLLIMNQQKAEEWKKSHFEFGELLSISREELDLFQAMGVESPLFGADAEVFIKEIRERLAL